MKQKIKILRIINRFNLGGPTYNAAYLTKYMSDNFETLLIGGTKYEEEESSEFILNELGITPTVISEMQREISLKNDKAAYQKIKKIIKDYQPDIVHTHASKAGALGRLAAKSMKVPVVVHTFHGHVFHSYFGKTKTLIYKNIERYLAKQTDKIIAISEIQKEELSAEHKICNPSKIEVIPLGFDLSCFHKNMKEKRNSFRNKYKIDDEEIAIGIIGRIVPIKNHDLFLKVAANLKNQTTKKMRFFIIGDGEEKPKLKQLCQDYKLNFTEWNETPKQADVTFTSWIKDIDRANVGLDIITLTSFNEGTPVSLIEAQASNKPIVTTNAGGVKNVTIENKTAFITEIHEISKFTMHLKQLVEDDALREEMGKNGWSFVNQKFSYLRLVSEMEKLYFTLLKKKNYTI